MSEGSIPKYIFEGVLISARDIGLCSGLSADHVTFRISAFELREGDDVTSAVLQPFPWEYYALNGKDYLVEDLAVMANISTNALRLRLSHQDCAAGDDITDLIGQVDVLPALYRYNGRGITVEELSRQLKVCKTTTQNRLAKQGFNVGDDITYYLHRTLKQARQAQENQPEMT